MRASDADREQVSELLRKHHTEGRLDSEEMQQRIDACLSAKTIGDLEGLLDDLPRQHPRDAGGPSHAGPGFGRGFLFGLGRRGMPRLWPILIGLLVLSIVTGHFFWLAIPLVFIGFRRFAPWCRRPRSAGYWT
jgi:hypothetical protein